MMGKYILKGHRAVLAEDLLEWAKWFEDSDNRRVRRTEVGTVQVSTVFLGVDHNFGPSGPPLLFETMVFGGPLDQEQDRYASWQEAAEGHERMVRRVQEKNLGSALDNATESA